MFISNMVGTRSDSCAIPAMIWQKEDESRNNLEEIVPKKYDPLNQ